MYDETPSDWWNMDDFTGGLMGWTLYSGAMNVMEGYACYQYEDVIDFTGTLTSGNWVEDLIKSLGKQYL